MSVCVGVYAGWGFITCARMDYQMSTGIEGQGKGQSKQGSVSEKHRDTRRKEGGKKDEKEPEEKSLMHIILPPFSPSLRPSLPFKHTASTIKHRGWPALSLLCRAHIQITRVNKRRKIIVNVRSSSCGRRVEEPPGGVYYYAVSCPLFWLLCLGGGVLVGSAKVVLWYAWCLCGSVTSSSLLILITVILRYQVCISPVSAFKELVPTQWVPLAVGKDRVSVF